MELVKVNWFNQLKNFGEGETPDGKLVLLLGKALPAFDGVFPLTPGKEIFCEIRENTEGLFSYAISLEPPAVRPTRASSESDVDV